jgi:hypothetical protein
MAQLCQSLPPAARDHVYVFFINGLDPVCLGNLTGLRNHVQSLGYQRTYYGQCFHGHWFAKEIRRLRAEDPDAHIVIVGFSLGTNIGRGLCQTLHGQGIFIDSLVCLSSNNLIDFSHERPENVGHYVDVLVHGRDLGENADPLTERHNLGGFVWHFGSPTHQEVLQVLDEELARIAGTVAVPIPEVPPPPFQPPGVPAPRPAPLPQAAAPHEGWDLLTPTAFLREPPSLVPSAADPAGKTLVVHEAGASPR